MNTLQEKKQINIKQDAYEEWSCTLSLEDCYRVLGEFETNQILGIRIIPGMNDEYEIMGWKGKPDNCYDTGRSVHYKGNCLAVLDDDNHFIFRNMRICEKTANVYMLPVYHQFLEITEPDPELYERLATDPIPFDCDTFFNDSMAVSGQISYEKENPEVSIMYTGPFRCIILKNGTMLRRGLPVSLSKASRELLNKDEYISLDLSAPLVHNYLDFYGKFGPIFLLNSDPGAGMNSLPDIQAVNIISDVLKERIKNLIHNKHDYFILQGSDPAEKDSCCPHPLIPELQNLIRAGIMSSWASPGSGTCPMTVYAFNGELTLKEDSFPVFKKNEFLRRSVINLL